jgi:hypothetical protein
MKKVFVLALAFAGLTTAVKAQKGSILVGGDFDFTSTNNQNTAPATKTSAFTFDPTVGYQFTDHFTAGLTANLATTKQDNGTTTKTSSFDLGPFIRYAQPLSSVFSVYGQLEGLFGSQTTTPSTVTVNTVNVNLFPAVFINLKNSFGLNFNVGGLSYQTSSATGLKSISTFDFNFGKELTIGLSKNFGGKK